jgi:hypothetical protein
MRGNIANPGRDRQVRLALPAESLMCFNCGGPPTFMAS